jgi:alkylation response protein AidB-like acyl-CoA dehydrogenase
VREILEADSGYSQGLWKGVAELGWLGVSIPEEYGGAGFGYLESAMIAGEIGAALAPIPFASTVYLAAEAIKQAGDDGQKKKYLTGYREWRLDRHDGDDRKGRFANAKVGECHV